jgi:PilZ domain
MASDTENVLDAPAAGSSATVLNLANEHPYAATVASWVGTAAGLVVSARVMVTSNAARALAGQRVLVFVGERPNGFTVFSGIARPGEGSTLDVFAIAMLVRERRRQDLRAPAGGQVNVFSDGRPVRQLRAMDVCRGGVRVRLAVRSELRIGEHVTVEVDLGYGSPLAARGEVTRVDVEAGHAVVRFEDLSTDDGTMVDRFVLLQLPRYLAPAG